MTDEEAYHQRAAEREALRLAEAEAEDARIAAFAEAMTTREGKPPYVIHHAHWRARAIVPDFAFIRGRFDREYTPWIILHQEEDALETEVLQRLFDHHLEDIGSDFSEFFPFLEAHGYIVMNIRHAEMAVIDTRDC